MKSTGEKKLEKINVKFRDQNITFVKKEIF